MLDTSRNPRIRDKSSDNIIQYKNISQKRIGPFALGEKIGKGTFAVVRLGTHLLTREKVAIKVLEKQEILKRGDKTRVEREIKILKSLRHNNIIQLYYVIQTFSSIYLIMEFASGKELFEYIILKKKLKEIEACRFFQQIISGVEYLHKLKIVHRDFKPENLLLDHKKNIKIVDFGLSNLYSEGELLKTPCGSPCYAAPEMIMGNSYEGEMVDIWSCGVILYAMICGYLPFEDNNDDILYKKITEGQFTIPNFVSELGKDMIKSILNIDPKKRYSISLIKNHPWFNLTDIHLNMHEGLLLNFMVIPIDENIVTSMIEYGFPKEETRACVLSNRHNHVTTAYYLLLKTKIRKGKSSISDLVSKEFKEFLNDSTNLFANYDYNYANVVQERAMSTMRLNNEAAINAAAIARNDENEKICETLKDFNKILTHRSFTPSQTMRRPDDISNITSDENINLFKQKPEKKKIIKKDKNGKIQQLNNSIDLGKSKFHKIPLPKYQPPTSTPTQKKTIGKIAQIKRIQDRIKEKIVEQYPVPFITNTTAQGNTIDSEYLPTEAMDKLYSDIINPNDEESNTAKYNVENMKDYIASFRDDNDNDNNNITVQSTITKRKSKEQSRFKYQSKDLEEIDEKKLMINIMPTLKGEGYCTKTTRYTPHRKSIDISPNNISTIKQMQRIKGHKPIPLKIIDTTINYDTNIMNNKRRNQRQKNFFNTTMSFEREGDEKNATFDSIIINDNEDKATIQSKPAKLHKLEIEKTPKNAQSLSNKRHCNNKLKDTNNNLNKNSLDKKNEPIKQEDSIKKTLFKKNVVYNQKNKPEAISLIKNTHNREMTETIHQKIPSLKYHNKINIKNYYTMNTDNNYKEKNSLEFNHNEFYTKRSVLIKRNIRKTRNNNHSIDNNTLHNEKLSTIRKTIKEQFNRNNIINFYHPKQTHHLIQNYYTNNYSLNITNLSVSENNTQRRSKIDTTDCIVHLKETIKEINNKEGGGINFEKKDIFIPGESKEKTLGDKLRIWEGPIDPSTIFIRTPQEIREDLIKIIVSHKIFYKISKLSSYKLACQKFALKFEIEIFQLNEFKKSHFVKFKKIEGSSNNYRELTTKILDKILLL